MDRVIQCIKSVFNLSAKNEWVITAFFYNWPLKCTMSSMTQYAVWGELPSSPLRESPNVHPSRKTPDDLPGKLFCQRKLLAWEGLYIGKNCDINSQTPSSAICVWMILLQAVKNNLLLKSDYINRLTFNRCWLYNVYEWINNICTKILIFSKDFEVSK